MNPLNRLKLLSWHLRVKLARVISKADCRIAQQLRQDLECTQGYAQDAEEQKCRLERELWESNQTIERLKQPAFLFEKFGQWLKSDECKPTWQDAAPLVNTVVDRLIRPFHKSVSWGDRLLTIDKSLGIAHDPVFEKAFATFRGKHPYDQYDGPDSIIWRLNTLVWGAREALNLEGDFVECGVFKGDMSYTIAKCLGFEALARTFYLYDSFEGFSPKYSSAADFPLNPRFFDFANKVYQTPGIYEDVCARFAGMNNVKVIRGFLPDSLSIAAPEKIAFLHIDLNSAAPEIGCLEALFPRVVPGGIIIFDDFGWIDYSPQKVAEDAFFAERGYRVLELPSGQGLVVKR